MLKSSRTIELKAASAAVSIDGFAVKHITVDVQRSRVAIRGILTLAGEPVRIKSLEIDAGEPAIAAFVAQVETGLKKKFAEKLGFDDAKTSVE